MAAEENLLLGLKECLMNSGEFHKIKSELRFEILRTLGLDEFKKIEKPPPPKDIILVNYLIKEYLCWIGYKYTDYMLSSESGLPHCHHLISRGQMESELNLMEECYHKRRPLLLQLIQDLKNNKLCTN